MTNDEKIKEHSLSLIEILKAAQFFFEIAGITGKQLAIALDKIYKYYMGYSALEVAEIDLNAPEKTAYEADTADEDDDDYYADGERVLMWKPEIIPILREYIARHKDCLKEINHE